MKIFLFSRRFSIPLLLALVVHVGYLTWELWRLYKEDIVGKGIPGIYQREWMFTQGGMFVSSCFLLSFIIGIVYYSHFQFRVKKESYRPFSAGSWVGVIFMGLALFLYNEYYTTEMYSKSRTLLTDFVYSKPGEKFIKTSKEQAEKMGIFSVKTASLSELYHARDSVTADKGKKMGGFVGVGTRGTHLVSMEKRITLEIGLRWSSPLRVIIFYVLGVLVACTFSRTYAFIPILVGWLGLYYLSQAGGIFFETKYKQGRLGSFLGNNAMNILLGLIGISWYFLLHQKGLFRNNSGLKEVNENQMKNN